MISILCPTWTLISGETLMKSFTFYWNILVVPMWSFSMKSVSTLCWAPTCTFGMDLRILKVLPRVKVIWWTLTLKQLHLAFCRKQRDEVTISVICSIWTACSFSVVDIVQWHQYGVSWRNSALVQFVENVHVAHCFAEDWIVATRFWKKHHNSGPRRSFYR